MSEPDIIIVGTGPAGVSVAWPLAEAGWSVLMLEGGKRHSFAPKNSRPSLAELRGDIEGWRHLLGTDLRGLREMDAASPRARHVPLPGLDGEYLTRNRLIPNGFRAIGALVPGGLSLVWGAVVPAFDRTDIEGWPIDHAALQPSLERVAERIGISGSKDDDMATTQGVDIPLQPALPLSACAKSLLRGYDASGRREDFTLGRARNAVLTCDKDGRRACDLGKGCMWGCPRDAVYSSRSDLDRMLVQHDNVRLVDEVVVESLAPRAAGGWEVFGSTSDGGMATFGAVHIVLAAGVLPSTRLALAATSRIDEDRRLLSTPAFVFALVLPRRLGRALETTGFGMAQLAFRLRLSPTPGDEAFGILYDADSFPAADLVERMPFSRRGALDVLGVGLPALMVGLVYLPGGYSRNRARLDPSGTLVIEGGVGDGHAATVRGVARRLARHFRACGGWMVPGSVGFLPPGAEVHYAGTWPMGESTTEDGEICEAPGLFIADGSVIPSLPAKHHTFSMMANADRIGRNLASKLRRDRANR
ncbi:MAG: GMC family oxidoreductase [Rhodospirillales bacterium]|nr:GMC family oxidoreductase [Rhodospirillales bacterium]